MKDFGNKVAELQRVISFRFRVGSGVGAAKEVAGKKIYDKYIVMGYIDARDCMDRLDEVFGPYRQREYVDIAQKSYCSVSLWDGRQWIRRTDVGEPTAIAKNKGESSDAFKRACVNRGLGRFLYTMPTLYITAEEYQANKWNVSGFIKKKYRDDLKKWYDTYDIKIDEIKSKYNVSDDDNDGSDPSLDMADITQDFSALPPNQTK